MARSASAAGAAVYGPIDQGDFLRAIGIDLRTKALAERATLDHAEEFERARARLVGKSQGEMGALFKTMSVADRRLRPPPGFQSASAKPGLPPGQKADRDAARPRDLPDASSLRLRPARACSRHVECPFEGFCFAPGPILI